MLLKQGMKGKEVRELQMALKALGMYSGDIDGDFGPKTRAAVVDFQDDYEELTIDGVVGAQTLGALDQALQVVERGPTKSWQPPESSTVEQSLICSEEVWKAFHKLVTMIVSLPVKYGPGRGLFVDGEWVVTHGPGRLNYKNWSSKIGETYPSFHCSSWTNFFLGWVSRRNADYTHAGNIPSLFKMCEASPSLHDNNGLAKWRGYNDVCKRFLSEKEKPLFGDSRVLDLRELYDRRAELPTFFVWGQSTKKGHKYKWWHHTGLFVVDHTVAGSPMFRIAADGYKGSSGYSASPMKYFRVTDDYVSKDVVRHTYRGYAISPPVSGDICSVVVED